MQSTDETIGQDTFENHYIEININGDRSKSDSSSSESYLEPVVVTTNAHVSHVYDCALSTSRTIADVTSRDNGDDVAGNDNAVNVYGWYDMTTY